MDRKVIYDPTADIAILAVLKFLKNNYSSGAAENLLKDIDKKVRQAIVFPDSGHSVESNPNIRYIIVRNNYNLYYTLNDDDDVYILDFWNTKQNPNKRPY